MGEFRLILYESIALEEVYIFVIEFVLIGWIVKKIFHKNWSWPLHFHESREIHDFLPIQRLLGSDWTQKTLNRALQGLSNGIKLH